MVAFSYLNLKPLISSQTIRQYSNIDTSGKIEGFTLSVTAQPLPDCEIVMLTGTEIGILKSSSTSYVEL